VDCRHDIGALHDTYLTRLQTEPAKWRSACDWAAVRGIRLPPRRPGCPDANAPAFPPTEGWTRGHRLAQASSNCGLLSPPGVTTRLYVHSESLLSGGRHAPLATT
jgi:hypothetical protein